MARGTALSDLLVQLRAEAGHSVLTAAGIDNKAALVQILNSVQDVLYDDFNWPFKKIMPFLNLTTGTRYYDLPASIDFEHIVNVAVYYNATPVPISKGIGYSEYAIYDSEASVKSTPVQRWDIKFTGTKEQIEVWPVPEDNTQKLQFVGVQKLVRMVNDADKATIDDTLLVLTCAAEILARQKNEDAPLKQKRAAARYKQLRGLYDQSSDTFVMGGGVSPVDSNRGKTVIMVR